MSKSHCLLVFEKFMKIHDEAYKVIEEAKSLSIAGNKEQAIAKYKDAHTMLDEALNIQYPSRNDVCGKRIHKMKKKMKTVKEQVLNRISICQRSQTAVSSPSAVGSHGLDISLRNLQLDTESMAACILYTHPEAQVYFISVNGDVETFSNSDALQVVKTEGGNRFYLQVGRWKYSIVPGSLSWSRTSENTFIFHETHSEDKGDSVAVVLQTVKNKSDSDCCNLFDEVLNQIIKAVPPPVNGIHEGLKSSISQQFVREMDSFSQKMIERAEECSQFMNYCTPKLKSILPQDSAQSVVNQDLLDSLHTARCVTEVTATATDFFACLESGARELGRYLSPHIQREGTRLLIENFNYSEDNAAETVDSFLQVTAGAVQGVASLYGGFRNSARILGRSLADNTVKIVEHKYGCSAAKATEDALYTIGNTLVTGYNVSLLIPKTSAKKTSQGYGVNFNGVTK